MDAAAVRQGAVLALLPVQAELPRRAEPAAVESPRRAEPAAVELPRRAEAAVVESPLHAEAVVGELPRRAEGLREARDYPEWSRHCRDHLLHLAPPARCRSRRRGCQ